MQELKRKVKGALLGIAYGDSFGMPTEMWTPEQIRERVGRITDFQKGHPENPISTKLKAGEVTDDTINSVLVIEMLAANHGNVDAMCFIGRLKEWIQSAEKSSTVVGPSTRRAIDLLDQGVPMQETGKLGTTNGGAMKILPVGLVAGIRAAADGRIFTETDLKSLTDEVEKLCMPTHYTSCSIGAAAAIAAGGAAAISGERDIDKIYSIMTRAAELGERRGNQVCGPSVAARMRMNQYFVTHYPSEEAQQMIYQYTGTGLPSTESIPAAAALLLLAKGDPRRCAEFTANIGGDTDTMGAMACGICGALAGADAFPEEAQQLLSRVNDIDFEALTDMLIRCVERI